MGKTKYLTEELISDKNVTFNIMNHQNECPCAQLICNVLSVFTKEVFKDCSAP